MTTTTGAPCTAPTLPRFDGFPYLVTRVVAGLYHILPVPTGQPPEQYRELLCQQVDANRLATCLVLGPETAWYGTFDRDIIETSEPPTGGIVVTGRLQPAEEFDCTPDLSAREVRLERFAKARNPGRYLVGDTTKGGRPATPAERDRLDGATTDGVPRGLSRCLTCGDWRGRCLDLHQGTVLRVHCGCQNHNRCARCGGPLAERRLNANYYDEVDGQVWYVPGFCGLGHRCSRARPKGSVC